MSTCLSSVRSATILGSVSPVRRRGTSGVRERRSDPPLVAARIVRSQVSATCRCGVLPDAAPASGRLYRFVVPQRRHVARIRQPVPRGGQRQRLVQRAHRAGAEQLVHRRQRICLGQARRIVRVPARNVSAGTLKVVHAADQVRARAAAGYCRRGVGTGTGGHRRAARHAALRHRRARLRAKKPARSREIPPIRPK